MKQDAYEQTRLMSLSELFLEIEKPPVRNGKLTGAFVCGQVKLKISLLHFQSVSVKASRAAATATIA